MTKPIKYTEPYKYTTYVWEGLGQGDSGEGAATGQFADRTVQITGELDGATVALQGSMDGDNWFPITTNGEDPIEGTGLFWAWENPKYMRPTVTGGGGSTAVTVTIGTSTLV